MKELILEELRQKGWNFKMSDSDQYLTRYLDENTNFILALNLSQLEKSLIVAISIFPFKIIKEHTSQISSFLNDLNSKTSVGSFQLSLNEKRQISYRAGVYFFNTSFQVQMVQNLMDTVVSYSKEDYLEIQNFIQQLDS